VVNPPGSGPIAFENLRRVTRSRNPAAERCELCSAELGPLHCHLLAPQTHAIVCSCDACAVLFTMQQGQSYRRIPRSIRFLGGFVLSDAQWEALNIPINLAFFCRTGTPARPTAFYPSPAGTVESLLDLESWHEICDKNPGLSKMEDEVEALLINRTTTPHGHYLVPIDECYRLVGLTRAQWRGFSGGKDMWQSIATFFVSLRERAITTLERSHA
jgi:hypothetical protein